MDRMYNRRGLLSGRGRGQGGGGGSVLGSLGPRDGPPFPPQGFGRSGRGGIMGGPQTQSVGSGRPYQRPPLIPQGPPGRDAVFRNAGLLQMTMAKRVAGNDSSWDAKRPRMDKGRQSDTGFNRRGGRMHSDGGTEYDPSRPTDDGSPEHFCRVCKVSCWDEESMERHMSGKKHQVVVENMRRGGHNSGPAGHREYCRTCAHWIDGSFESHKESREHTEKAGRRKVAVSGTKPANNSSTDATEVKAESTPEKTKPETSSTSASKEVPKEETNGKEASPEVDEEGTAAEVEIEIPEYSEKTSFGREYVVPVSGFFCRLCSKFYSSDTTAYEVHCRSRVHYDKYVVALEEQRSKKNGDDGSVDTKTTSGSSVRGRGGRRGNSRG